jgi:hypothetical protein
MSERNDHAQASQTSGGAPGADRALYIISVAAELAGVHPQTLRIYERKGLIEPSRTQGRSRRYSDRDISQLRHIQELTNDGVAWLESAGSRARDRAERAHAEIACCGSPRPVPTRPPGCGRRRTAATGAISHPSAGPSSTSADAEQLGLRRSTPGNKLDSEVVNWGSWLSARIRTHSGNPLREPTRP